MMMVPHPRDFTSGRYKIRSTETGSIPTDDDLLRSVRQGLYGSAMPAWEPILSDADIRAVVHYIKKLSPRFADEQPHPVTASSPVAATPTSFEDEWGYPLRAADLSEPWTFHGGPTPADVFMRFRAGISGTPMPSYQGAATDPEMWDL